MRVLIAVDLNDDDLAEAFGHDLRETNLGDEWDDICGSFAARMEEVYVGPHATPVRGRVTAAGDFTDAAFPALLDAAEVGADGIEDDHVRGHVFGSLVTMREGLDA